MVSRKPMHVSPNFEEMVKKIQKEIMMKEGKRVSLTEITNKIAKNPAFSDLNNFEEDLKRVDIKINFDRRLL